MSVAAPLVLREGDRSRLEALTRSSSVRAGVAQRARIVLLAADGLANAEIARRTGTSRPTVVGWRARYETGGVAALEDLPRSGRPVEVDEIAVVVATLADEGRPPQRLGVTHWSARLLAAELGIGFATVARIWRKWKLQPVGAENPATSCDLHVLMYKTVEPVSSQRPDGRAGARGSVACGRALTQGSVRSVRVVVLDELT
jgi:transposase